MNIGVDIDEVLAELTEAFLEYHNRTYGTSFKKKDMFSYSYHEVIGGTEEETRQKLLAFFNTDFFRNIKTVEGAKEAIALLAKKHQLSIITARPHFIRQQTEHLIESHFPKYFSSIILTNQWHGIGAKRSKSEVCKERKVSIMIDDSLHHAKDCAAQGIYVLLMDIDYPWNQATELPENIKRVHSWEEIVTEIDNYGKRTRR